MPENSVEYLSVDRVARENNFEKNLEDVFNVEFLNNINFSGLQNYRIVVKVGCMIMLPSCTMAHDLYLLILVSISSRKKK